MVFSFLLNTRWETDYFAVPSRYFVLGFALFVTERVGASLVLERDVVSGPNPWLASDVT